MEKRENESMRVISEAVDMARSDTHQAQMRMQQAPGRKAVSENDDDYYC